MTTKYNLVALIVFVACMATDASADETGAMFKFSGFGTLGASHSSQDLGDYVLDSTIPKGPGLSNNWAVGNDSRIGVQLKGSFSPRISAVLQVVSEYQADGSYSPDVEWANVKYAFSPDAYIRFGRIALPTFMDSDNRDVGYSYPWIHSPIDLYRQLAINSSDGVDAKYHFEIGEGGNSVRAIYGRNTIERPTSKSISKDMWGIFDTLEYGPATLHIGYQQRESASHNDLTGVTGAWVSNTDLSLGAGYDPGNWFVISEWMQRKSTYKSTAMYLSAGYRVDKFTPYLTYSQNSPGTFLPGFPAPSANSIRLANRSESTTSLGVRWDFMKNTDFKVQYDQVKLGDNSNGYLANVPTNVILYGTRLHVISAVIDFVF